jgi:ABC-type phosphate transport system permease subunit
LEHVTASRDGICFWMLCYLYDKLKKVFVVLRKMEVNKDMFLDAMLLVSYIVMFIIIVPTTQDIGNLFCSCIL